VQVAPNLPKHLSRAVAEAALKSSKKIVQVALSEKPMFHPMFSKFQSIGIQVFETLFSRASIIVD
jgi:hypothetical protein